ncbi:DUF221-domain-containing protein [Clavulina sp. PMI_390]|nr:DUF221-domain-containing protein [Clavulina sp. PMI_390]
MDAARNVLLSLMLLNDDTDTDLPLPNKRKFSGPWLQTQLTMACGIGLFSFLVFSYCRTRIPVLFAPRTKLKGFSPIEAHAHSSFFAWILPTIRTSEFTVLQIVGLDAAVLLNFFKMSFYLFSSASVLALCILMPANYRYNDGKWYDDGDDDDEGGTSPNITSKLIRRVIADPPTKPDWPDWLDMLNDANSIHTLHLFVAYAFTILTLRFLYVNYLSFIRSRQLYSLQLVHSVAARTIMVTDLPEHLRGEHALAIHFEQMDLSVESVSLCRELGSLEGLIQKRTDILLQLELAWTNYVGNPSEVSDYDPSVNIRNDLSSTTATASADEESQRARLVVPHRTRPTIRPTWFGKKVDALEYLQARFVEADEAVRRKRRSAKLKATATAFVTFETMAHAQIASQVVSNSGTTALAPEPRDVVWSAMTLSRNKLLARQALVFGLNSLLFFFWIVPVSLLASLLSYEELKKATPWLVHLIDKAPSIRALVQNTLPSTALIVFNGVLPLLLEVLSYIEGHKARSLIEYALLKKYFLFLLVNVVFIFLLASTYWQLVRDLANSPAKVPEKLAQALRQGQAKSFFVSYVVLQGFGVMPLQLLNLGTIVPRIFMRMFFTRTPRDFAELNAPPMINYGAVYPQAILIFVITLLYSVIQPLILIFGAIYFGIGYVVYKYKLLFVFYKPYESRGQAWPITFARLVWGVIIFQVFMIGVFSLSKSFILSTLMAPMLIFTIWWAWYMDRKFTPQSQYVNLDSVYEVQRGGTDEMARLTGGELVSSSHTYSQPPMSNFYYGVLNTGKRRYGHPALNGVLPQPWLPLKKGQTLANFVDHDDDTEANTRQNGGKRKKPRKSSQANQEAVVLTLRRRYSVMRKAAGRLMGRESEDPTAMEGSALVDEPEGGEDRPDAPRPPSDTGSTASAPSNPWRDTAGGTSQGSTQPRVRRLSYDLATGIMNLPDDDGWISPGGEEADSDDDAGHSGGTTPTPPGQDNGSESPAPAAGPSGSGSALADQKVGRRTSTYWHHPDRKRVVSGNFGA